MDILLVQALFCRFNIRVDADMNSFSLDNELLKIKNTHENC